MDPERAPRTGLTAATAIVPPRPAAQALRRYLLTAYGLSWSGQIAIGIWGGLEGRLFRLLAPLLMFTPTLAAFVACRHEGYSFRRLVRLRSRVVPLIAAVLVPVATALATAFTIAGLLGGRPVPWSVTPGGIAVPDEGPFLLGGVESVPLLLANIAVTAVWLALLGGLLAVGEEIGWRGYLQPRLCARFGTVPGLVAVGLLHSFWHLPLLLQGYVFPAAPLLGGLVLFPLVGIALAFFLGWLRDASGGIWAPILAHGAYNAFFGTLVFTMDFGDATLGAYLVIVALTSATGVLSLPLARRAAAAARAMPTPQGAASRLGTAARR